MNNLRIMNVCAMENKKKKKMLAVTTEFVFLSFRHTCTLIHMHTHETHTHTRAYRGTHTYMKSMNVNMEVYQWDLFFWSRIRFRRELRKRYTQITYMYTYTDRQNTISSSVYIVFVEYRFCRRRDSVNYFPSISNERARAYCNHTGDRMMMTRF